MRFRLLFENCEDINGSSDEVQLFGMTLYSIVGWLSKYWNDLIRSITHDAETRASAS